MLEAYHDRLYNDFEKIMKADKHLLFKMKKCGRICHLTLMIHRQK